MDATTLFMLGGAAYAWWKSRTPALTPEQQTPSIEVEPLDADIAVPALTVHLVGESAPGKDDGMLLMAFPVTEEIEAGSLGRYRRFGATAPAPAPMTAPRTVYRPSGPVRAVVPRPPRPMANPPKPPKPTALQASMPVVGAVLAAMPLAQVGLRAVRGQDVGVGEVITATGFTAAGIVAQFAPPLVSGGVSAGARTVQYFSGNINAANTANYFGGLAKDGVRMAQVAIPALGFAISATVSFVKAFSDMDGPNFGRHIGEGLGSLAGAVASVVGGPLAGLITGLAGNYIGGKIGAWWDRKQAIAQQEALKGINGPQTDALLAAQWESWGQEQHVAEQALQAQQDWWDSPAGTAAYQQYAAADEPLDPTLLPEAGEGLSTEIVNLDPVPTPTAELTAEQLAALGLTEEEIDIAQHGAEEWTGGFGVPQPDDLAAEPAPDTAPIIARTWEDMVALSMVPHTVKLVGAWDALIFAYSGSGAIAECSKHAAPGSGARCLALYADGSKTYFDAGTDLNTVPGSVLS